MKRIIKFSVIGETAALLKQQIETLKVQRNNLLKDITKIDEGYKGSDATLIIQKYKNKLVEIDRYINILEKYQICFEWLSGSYRDTHNRAKNNLERLIPTDNLTSETINLNGIIDGGNV